MHEIFAPPRITQERLADGRVLIRSAVPVGEHPVSVVHSFRAHSEAHPERVLVAERGPDGTWARSTWGEVRALTDRLAQGLLDRGLAERPVMVLSGNSRLHLALTLAAMTVGAPVVPTSVAYSLQSADHVKLRALADLADPGVVVAEEAAFAEAVAAISGGRLVLGPQGMDVQEFGSNPTAEVDRRCAALRRADIAKILFTSGSTGHPKGVLNTHGMLAANQQQMRQAWPFLDREPPVLLDWLPWSHTFGGNHNLNMVLTHGGELWIDDGRPAPPLIGRTARNLMDVRPTLYFNVPAGWAALVPLLEDDPDLARAFLDRLRLGFFAAAALPQQLWDRLEAVSAQHGGRMSMTSSWGLTETAPAATSAHFPITRSDVLGVPLPGVEVALVPVGQETAGQKTEIRVKGPNVTPGYHGRPDLTRAAFDEHGFLRTGDAGVVADHDDVGAGLLFRGRIAEDFKLATGTFVSVGTLRPRLLSAAQGLLSDAVICGADGDCVTAMVWLAPAHANRVDSDGVPERLLRSELADAMARLAEEGGGTSQCVERLLVLVEPPALDAGEITDKGYVNQAAVRDRRADLAALLDMTPLPTPVVRR